ncbi:MAG: hypothetical protein R3A11_02500 [Bdellovibrionota bacterium]
MSRIPTWIEKQKVLFPEHGRIDAEKLFGLFHICFEQECYQDALEYALGSKNDQAILKIKTKAIELGDAFMLNQIVLGGYTVTDQEWESTKQTAQQNQQNHFARLCEKHLSPQSVHPSS